MIPDDEELRNREAIRDSLYRYCIGVDRRDRSMLQSVYWPEATEDRGGDFKGDIGQFIDWMLERTAPLKRTHHFLGNIFIRIDGNRATAESYLHGYHRMENDEGLFDEFLAGRYHDVFEKRGNEWRVLARRFIFDWFRVVEGQDQEDRGYHGRGYAPGRRKPQDPFYRLMPTFLD
jgi:hypothetical protein